MRSLKRVKTFVAGQWQAAGEGDAKEREETVNLLYSIGTWDTDAQAYTPQNGLSRSPINCTWRDLLQICRELCRMGYSCHYVRDADGSHDYNDPTVLIERTDGMAPEEIFKSWER
jgi:hypothetical protein